MLSLNELIKSSPMTHIHVAISISMISSVKEKYRHICNIANTIEVNMHTIWLLVARACVGGDVSSFI